MNYYEELGIPRDADPDDIHEAYKLAAQLLHPDKQIEPRLKAMAERQMKRLSVIAAVLTNPSDRLAYDATLTTRTLPVAQPPPAPLGGSQILQAAVRQWFWVLLVSMMAAMGGWYISARSSDPNPSVATEHAKAPSATASAQSEGPLPVKKLRSKPGQTRFPNSARLLQQEPAREVSPSGVHEKPPVPALVPAEPSMTEGTPSFEPAAVAADGPHTSESRFAGEWLYATDARADDRTGSYPASYVEFHLWEKSGRLAGEYRALHRITDKAISPEVAFRVEGKSPAADRGTLGWESSTGAKGELELTLASPNQLQVKWWTTQFGKQEALGSGMATLVRMKTP